LKLTVNGSNMLLCAAKLTVGNGISSDTGAQSQHNLRVFYDIYIRNDSSEPVLASRKTKVDEEKRT